MIIKCGVDLVYLPRFKKSLKRGGEKFLQRVFTERELIHLRGGLRRHAHLEGEMPHLAGIFAAKEAVIKALSLPIDSWHDIHVVYKPNGVPQVQISSAEFTDQISNSSLSISHDGNYIISQFIAILKE